MPSITALGNILNTPAGGAKTVPATPAVGDLIIIIVANTGYTGVVAPTDNNTDGFGTYTLVPGSTSVKAASVDTMQVFVRDRPIGSATSTIFSHTAASSTGGGIAVYKVASNPVNYSVGAVRQVAIQSNIASGVPTPVFGVAALTGNPIIGAV